jgi:hypothetical protein
VSKPSFNGPLGGFDYPNFLSRRFIKYTCHYEWFCLQVGKSRFLHVPLEIDIFPDFQLHLEFSLEIAKWLKMNSTILKFFL